MGLEACAKVRGQKRTGRGEHRPVRPRQGRRQPRWEGPAGDVSQAGAWAPLSPGQLLSGPAPNTGLQNKVRGREAQRPTQSAPLWRPETIRMDSRPPARGQAAGGETEAQGGRICRVT